MITRFGYGQSPQLTSKDLKRKDALANQSINSMATINKNNCNIDNKLEPLKQAHDVSFKGSFITAAKDELTKIKLGEIISPAIIEAYAKQDTSHIGVKALNMLKEATQGGEHSFVDKTMTYLKDHNVEKTILGNIGDTFKDILLIPSDAINMTLDVMNHIPFVKGKPGTELRKNIPFISEHLQNRMTSIKQEVNSYSVRDYIKWFEQQHILLNGDEKKLKEAITKKYVNRIGNDLLPTFGIKADRTWGRFSSGIPSAIFLAADASNLTMLLKNDKKEAEKERKTRFLQETGRVGISAAIMFFMIGSLKKITNKSLPAALAVTVFATGVAEVLGRKLAGKRILPMSKEAAAQLAAKNQAKESQKVQNSPTQGTTAPTAKKTAFSANPVTVSATNSPEVAEPKKANMFKVGLELTAGFAASMVAVATVANLFKHRTIPQEASKLAEIFELSKTDHKQITETMFKTIKTNIENLGKEGKKIFTDGTKFDEKYLESIETFTAALKDKDKYAGKTLHLGIIDNRYAKSFVDQIIILPQDILGGLFKIPANFAKYLVGQVDTAFANAKPELVKTREINETIKSNLNGMMVALREKLPKHELVTKANLVELTDRGNFVKYDVHINQIFDSLKAVLTPETIKTEGKGAAQALTKDSAKAIKEQLVKTLEKSEIPHKDKLIETLMDSLKGNTLEHAQNGIDNVKSTIIETLKDKAFTEDKIAYVDQLVAAVKAEAKDSKEATNALYEIRQATIKASEEEPASVTTDNIRHIFSKLNYEIKKTDSSLTPEKRNEYLKEQFTRVLGNNGVDGWNKTNAQSYSSTELSTWMKVLGSGLSAFFLVSDAYNLVMEKTGGKDQKLAQQKAQERAVQEVSRNLFSSYFVKGTNELFKPLYNSNLIGQTLITVGNVTGYEALTRAAVGIPITTKTREEILKADAANAAKTGFWGGYFKFMSYVTGKKSLSSRVNKPEAKTVATVPPQQTVAKAPQTPQQQPTTVNFDKFKAFKKA
ncbi:MAG: hypothetical protein WCK67_12410 [bacterium]